MADEKLETGIQQTSRSKESLAQIPLDEKDDQQISGPKGSIETVLSTT